MKTLLYIIFLSLAVLAGCATYHYKPLDQQSTLLDNIPHLLIDPAKMPLPELTTHRFDPSNGLDMTEVAMLAVANNPDLKAARDEAGISRAQAFAAGLLPDPVLNLGEDFPTVGGPGITSAYNIGLSYDIKALVTRPARKAAAEEDARKTDLNILWQEWQVVGQARLLFVKSVYQEKLMKVLLDNVAILSERYDKSSKALAEGNTTIDAVSANLVALQDSDRKVKELARQINQTRHDLNALLGLSPGLKLNIVDETDLPELDAEKIRRNLEDLPHRRPDLLALEAGYQSQEQRFRQAILAQFPDLSIGLTRARDTSNVSTIGFGITMSLPIFDRNRGNIKVEDATRQKLHDEYSARLDAAYGEISRIMAEQELLERQLKDVDDALPVFSLTAENAEKAYKEGNMDVVNYANLQSSLYDKRAEAIEIQESIMEQRVLLQTLIGGELPMKTAGAVKSK
jgi:outer membrane protein TolC